MAIGTAPNKRRLVSAAGSRLRHVIRTIICSGICPGIRTIVHPGRWAAGWRLPRPEMVARNAGTVSGKFRRSAKRRLTGRLWRKMKKRVNQTGQVL